MSAAFVERINWSQFRNASGHTVPPWGCMAVTSIELSADNEEKIYVIERPSTTFRSKHVINGRFAVANGDYGDCTQDIDIIGAYDPTATPAYGDGFGPKPDSFLLFKGYPSLFRVEGIYDTTNKLLFGGFRQAHSGLGKLDGALSQGSSATVSIWGGVANAEVDTTFNITAYDWLMKSGATAIASGKKVKWEWIDGYWYVVEAECA